MGVGFQARQGVLEVFEVETGRYPTTEEGLGALISEPADVQGWHGPYIKRGVPSDPWGNLYEYRYPGQENEDGYDLWSKGPDTNDDGGKEGSDDIKNWIEK